MKIKKFKIDKSGVLWYERAGIMKEQRCRYYDGIGCGDECPSFHEPYIIQEYKKNGEEVIISTIEICDARANIAGEIVDERLTK